ncbi:MAG TPA: hypothetical protein VM840_12810 [Actinomycetota bacterium]|nr:hypothetical protein [Actinomycetota bacterium]
MPFDRMNRFVLGALAIFLVGAVVAVLASVFAPRDTPSPTPTPVAAPRSSANVIALQEGFREYLQTRIGRAPGGGAVFCTWDLLGHADVADGVDAYIWAYCEEYMPRSGSALRGETLILPALLHTRGSDGVYEVVSHEVPRPGETYAEDVQRIFPSSLHGAILGPGAVGVYPSAPRIRALEELRVPIQYVDPVDVVQPTPDLRTVHEGRIDQAAWALDALEVAGPSHCLAVRTEPVTAVPEDAPATGHRTCVPAPTEPTAIRKVAEAIAVDAGYAWAVGQAAGADEVEAVFTDQRRQTYPVRNGLWIGVYDATHYMAALVARSQGRVVAACGEGADRSC